MIPVECSPFHPSSLRPHPCRLKAEPKLKLCDAPGKCGESASEVSRVRKVRVASSPRLEWREIENVEDIKEVGAHLQIRRFAQMQETGQTRSLDEAHINRAVVRPTERVAP